MRTIFLHIGKHKTGTSSIQHYLTVNSEFFKKMNFHVAEQDIYPFVCRKSGLTANCTNVAHIAIRSCLQTPLRLRNSDIVRTYAQRIKDALFVNFKLHKIADSDIIMSSEAFSYIRNYRERLVLMAMFKGFNVVPIVCFRNKKDWLKSWRAQTDNLMKNRPVNTTDPAGIFNFSNDSWLVDDDAIARIYGKKTRTINYDQAISQHGSVIPAFLDIIDVDTGQYPSWAGIWRNRS